MSEDEAEAEAAGFLTHKTRTRSHELVLLHTITTTTTSQEAPSEPVAAPPLPASNLNAAATNNRGCDQFGSSSNLMDSVEADEDDMLPYDTRL